MTAFGSTSDLVFSNVSPISRCPPSMRRSFGCSPKARAVMALATLVFRERAMHEIMLRWPITLSLPIMPTGAMPLPRDLVRTPNGYVVDPSEAHKYELGRHG